MAPSVEFPPVPPRYAPAPRRARKLDRRCASTTGPEQGPQSTASRAATASPCANLGRMRVAKPVMIAKARQVGGLRPRRDEWLMDPPAHRRGELFGAQGACPSSASEKAPNRACARCRLGRAARYACGQQIGRRPLASTSVGAHSLATRSTRSISPSRRCIDDQHASEPRRSEAATKPLGCPWRQVAVGSSATKRRAFPGPARSAMATQPCFSPHETHPVAARPKSGPSQTRSEGYAPPICLINHRLPARPGFRSAEARLVCDRHAAERLVVASGRAAPTRRVPSSIGGPLATASPELARLSPVTSLPEWWPGFSPVSGVLS